MKLCIVLMMSGREIEGQMGRERESEREGVRDRENDRGKESEGGER